jgi:predicted Zn-dependent peptidase
MSASTLTDDTATALGALLEHLDAMADQPKASEVQTSTRRLQNQLLLRLETTAAATDLASRLSLFSLADGYYAGYRAELGRVSATEVQATAAQFFRSTEAVVVVTGDARRLERPLSHFSQVHILNPQDGFRVERVVTHDPSAPTLISTPPGR